jgi:hypothetical protein
MQEQITEDWAEARLSEWEETMADADNELNSARSSKNKDAIKEAQEVWHWTKEQLEMAAARVVALQAGLDIPELTTSERSAETSEMSEEE